MHPFSVALLHVALLSAIVFWTPYARASQELPWPYNLPPHVKYYPEEEVVVRRDGGILQRLQTEQPVIVKKMSPDPGEKFYLQYWGFDNGHILDAWRNMSTTSHLEPPLPLHADSTPSTGLHLWRRYLPVSPGALNVLAKRDFTCPSGTTACTSVDRPNACCPNSSTCQIVPDTGLGDVGCCDASETCAGSLSDCPSDYTSCPNSPGGGCCLPGYACFEEGCVQTSTTVVIVSASRTSTSSSSSLPTSVDTTTIIVTPVPTSTSPSVSPSTSTSIVSITSASSTSAPNSLVCSTGYRSCPASLGGGCCPTDRACGSRECPELSSTASLAPPVRGTTSADSITTTGASPTIIAGCPTGFYACSAFHQGGCCQVDRDCHSTSCPTRSEATVVDTSSLTVVAPSGSYLSQSVLTGACATGWSSCAASVGGGCCPSGYACGTAACSATANGQSDQVGKGIPNRASTWLGGTHLTWTCTLSIAMALSLTLTTL